MASSSAVSLQTLIEDALSLLARSSELSNQVTVGSTALTNLASSKTLTLNSATDWASVNVSDVLENGQELMLVTAKTTDATPIFTVARGYRNTPLQAAPTGNTLLVGPQWGRYELSRAIQRCLKGPMTAMLPNLTSTVISPTTNQFYVAMPANTVNVQRVAYQLSQTVGMTPIKRWTEVSGWTYQEDVPLTLPGVSTGKMIQIPYRLANVGLNAPTTVLNLYITYQVAYTWANGGAVPQDESDTVSIPLGAEDLPSIYAAAYLVAGREMSRLQVDKIEEWNHEASVRQGVNLRMVQMWWTEFYKRMDEARRIQNVPKHRPYRKYGRI